MKPVKLHPDNRRKLSSVSWVMQVIDESYRTTFPPRDIMTKTLNLPLAKQLRNLELDE